jgi:CHRD domain
MIGRFAPRGATEKLARNARVKALLAVTVAGVLASSGPASAGSGPSKFKGRLSGFEEDPMPISTPGNGSYTASIDKTDTSITYSLTFDSLLGTPTQAHIHFGNRFQSGGVMAFLCSNLGNAPIGTQACPNAGGTVTGTITSDDVIGPSFQGISVGELNALIAAMRAGTAYVDVASSVWPAGEIRGPIGHHK